jgi:hypothetical protein
MVEPDWKIAGTLAKAERDAVLEALVECDYKISNAAARLKIGRSTIYRLIATFEIDIPAKTKRRTARAPASRPAAPEPPASRIIFRDGKYLLTRD